MPQNDLEYVLFVETPNYGTIGMLLRNGGRHLGFARVGDTSLYRLVGEESPLEVKIGDEMIGRVKGVKQDWKIPLHGEWQNIGDVVEQLYLQTVDVEEEVISHDNFFSRNQYKAAAIVGFGVMGSFITAIIAANVFDTYKFLIYSAEGAILAGIFGGEFYIVDAYFLKRKRRKRSIQI